MSKAIMSVATTEGFLKCAHTILSAIHMTEWGKLRTLTLNLMIHFYRNSPYALGYTNTITFH